ncbi:SURF1 family protein [Vibrio sp. CAU 1672]|uniref:SURF1 family protein n=1 Tax=Vibrio sp. CAU 1672 TaxID=3032594 RepID=UPI0023DA0448|nr:SURF1 family protein [Vibrio sp. CAU 1672]MDF2152729.1 SURF1 family protein [Vibrio sp. CAU 1672]
MKSSKRTSVSLNNSTVDIAPPVEFWLWSKPFWLAVSLTVVVFSLLVKLGFWQLGRGLEKQALEVAIQARALEHYHQLRTIIDHNDWRVESIIGLKVSADVKPEPLPLILLDNQVYGKQVGYLAYQVVSLAEEPNVLFLLELGFVQGGKKRNQLPEIKAITQPVSITGRLYRKSTNPLSSDLLPELGNPVRIQNLNIYQLSELLSVELMPTVLQPDNLTDWSQPFPWAPLPMTSAKHFAYAFQWFAMAVVFAAVSLLVGVKWIYTRIKQEESA